MSFHHTSRGIHSSWFTMNKKKLWGHPSTHFPRTNESCNSLKNPYKDEITSCNCLTSQNRTCQCTQHLGYWVENATWCFFWQIIMQNPTMVYYIHDVHECPCHLHMISPESDKSFSPFHMRPPSHNNIQLSIRVSIWYCNPTFFKACPHSTTMCKPPWFWMHGKELDDT